MKAPVKLALYGLVLAAMVGGGAGIGAAAGPIDVNGEAEHEMPQATQPERPAADPGLPGGLAVAQDGYRLDLPNTTTTGGRPSTLGFRVLDDAGEPVTQFAVEHEKRLHLVVVGRNLVDYAHVHPTLGDDGTWRAQLPSLPAGSYRAFADFRPADGDALTLGADVTVTGSTTGVDVPPPSSHADADGYDVTLAGDPRPGESELAFTVSRAGETVRTDPYLGAAGHLVAIRDGDLAYLHVHPLDGDDDTVRFAAEFPSPGRYRLFLDFAHGGDVHTAAFTVDVPDTDSASTPAAENEHESH